MIDSTRPSRDRAGAALRVLLAMLGIGALILLTLAAAPASAGTREGSWLAGDLHVHTCYSHDAYCPPDDDNTGPDTIYSSGGTVLQRFTEAAAKGLDYLAISDHDDIRAHSDAAFGSQGVTGVRAYEASLAGGHAQMLGAAKQYEKGPGTPPEASTAGVNAMADALNRDGGVFQSNHPGYREEARFTDCAQAGLANWSMKPQLLHWRYGFHVRPDTIEVWNATTQIPPSELYWECWLQRGWHIGATGGSDSHGANQGNVGMPTSWVFARSRGERDIVEGIRQGRTTLSRLWPRQGALRLLLEADADGNGSFESMIGDTVRPGTKMRVRAEGSETAGLVRVRANGKTLLGDAPVAPGGTVAFSAPPESGWVRATLFLPQSSSQVDPFCRPNESPIDVCSADLAIAAMTSPIYLEKPGEPVGPAHGPPATAPGPGGGSQPPEGDEPDDDPPLLPGVQSGSGDPPDVPRQTGSEPSRAGAPAPRMRIHVRRLDRSERRSVGYRVSWRPPGYRYDLDLRPTGSRSWRSLLFGATRTSMIVRVRAGRNYHLRVRLRRPDGRPGPWHRSRTLQTRRRRR